ncbi:hypothetical protein Tco_1523215 [Tanacetum coccineum]
MTRSSNTKVFTPFANPERQFRSRKDITPIAVHNIYSFYECESSESESEDLSDIDIETLTLKQYLALNHNNSQVGVKRPEIEKSIVFEIKRAAKRWLGRTPSGLLKTWDELKQVFIQILWLTAIEALESIHEKVDHLHRWHKEESDKKTSNNSFSTITEKLKILNHDMNNLREGIHKINRKPNMKSRHEEVKRMHNDIGTSSRNTQIRNFLLKGEKAHYRTTLVNDIQKTLEYTRHLQELVSNKIQIEKLSMVKLNARCSAVLQNELPPKEKDPGIFVLPCVIGNTTIAMLLLI